MLTQEEINTAAGERSHTIELEEFVRGEEIDPVYYDRSHYLGAGKGRRDAYWPLHDALERSGRVGIGRWVFSQPRVSRRDPPRSIACSPSTRSGPPRELIDPSSLDLSSPSRAPSRREIQIASTLVDSLHARFDPHVVPRQLPRPRPGSDRDHCQGRGARPSRGARASGSSGPDSGARGELGRLRNGRAAAQTLGEPEAKQGEEPSVPRAPVR